MVADLKLNGWLREALDPGSKSAGWLDGGVREIGPAPADAPVTSIYLERREPARNRRRFYNIAVTRTLFGSWTLIREWGRIGHPGTVRETWFETEAAAIEAGAKIRRQKEKRGYRAIGGTAQI